MSKNERGTSSQKTVREKLPWYKNGLTYIGIVVAIVVIGVLGGFDEKEGDVGGDTISTPATSNFDESVPEGESNDEHSGQDDVIDEPPVSNPVDELRAAVEKELGRSNRDVQRVQDVAVRTDEFGANYIEVVWAINNNLAESYRGAWVDVGKILSMIRDSEVDYNSVLLTGTFSLIDKYGNAAEEAVLGRGGYARGTVEKINFKNISEANLYKIADFPLEVHRDLRPS